MKWNGWCPSHEPNIRHQGGSGENCGHFGGWHKGLCYLRSGRSLNTRPEKSRTQYNSDILFLPTLIAYYSVILFPFVSLGVLAYLLRMTTILHRLLHWSDKLQLLFASIVRFRSVKIVRPFCYRIITFFIVNKIRTKLIKKVKRIVDAILWNWEVLCYFSIHNHSAVSS